jgi:drug/metabolite transporter (DMT)-like permease
MKTAIFTTIVITCLMVIPILFLASHKRHETRLSRLAALAFAFMIGGLFLSRKEFVGYSLLGVGLVLAIIDIVQKRKQNKSHASHRPVTRV